MEHFDFDEIVPRRGTCSVKWDDGVPDGVLPMWVADMDFRTAPAVVEALRRRVEHGIYGYAIPPEAYAESIRGWFLRRHGWAPERECQPRASKRRRWLTYIWRWTTIMKSFRC